MGQESGYNQLIHKISVYCLGNYIFIVLDISICRGFHLFLLCLRLLRRADQSLGNLGYGVPSRHLLVAMKSQWGCCCLHQLPSWHGFHLFLNSRLVCSSIKLSAEVCRFAVFSEGTRETNRQTMSSARCKNPTLIILIWSTFYC